MKRLFHTYWPLIVKARRYVLAYVAVATVGGLGEAAGLAMLLPLLDPDGDGRRVLAIVQQGPLEGLDGRATALILFVGFGALAASLKLAGDLLLITLHTRFEAEMRQRTTDALLRMRWTSFLALRLGDISKGALAESYHGGIGFASIVRSIGALSVALLLLLLAGLAFPALTAGTLLFATLLGSVSQLLSRRAERASRQLSEAATAIGDHVADVFGNLKFFRTTGDLELTSQRAAAVFDDYRRVSYRGLSYEPISRLVYEASALVVVACVFVIALAMGDVDAGVVVFLGVFMRLAPRLMSVQESLHRARTSHPWVLSWQDRLAIADAARDVRSGQQLVEFRDSLELRNVSLRYPNATADALSGIDLSIGARDCIAVVGESGSGKTSLLDLLSGLLTPTSGGIYVDGVSLEDIDLQAWQSQVAIVMQDAPIFHMSVLENISWNDASPSVDRAWESLALANATSFVEALPNGIHAVVGERGGRLSGGQRQRLAIARALYREPSLLLLDEATSALDNRAEAEIRDTLEKIKGTCAVVIVAHRLSTIEVAEHVVVLDAGRVIEQGTLTELRRSAGSFSLLERQLAKP